MWNGHAARIVALLNARITEAVQSPDVREKLQAAGTEPATGTPEQFATLIAQSAAAYERIVRDAGIKAE